MNTLNHSPRSVVRHAQRVALAVPESDIENLPVSVHPMEPELPAGGPHVIFAGGASAGYLFPGIAVAQQLRAAYPEMRLTFIGAGKELQRRHVERAGFDYLSLSLPSSSPSPLQWLCSLPSRFGAVREASRFLHQEAGRIVVALGDHTSVPIAKAALRQNIPLVLLEPNAYPSRANRLLANSATLVCLSLAKAKLRLRTTARVAVTGNPLRPGFLLGRSRPAHEGDNLSSDTPRRRLLILGGSGGSSELNATVPKALHKVRHKLHDWHIVHQAGQADCRATETLYRKFQLPVTVVPFILNIHQVLRWTDLAICRAGGTTLSELAAMGVPAVLVPWAGANGEYQQRNAEVYARIGAAVTLDTLKPLGRLDDNLAEMLLLPLEHAEIRRAMSQAMLRLARPEAAELVASRLLQLLETPTLRRAA